MHLFTLQFNLLVITCYLNNNVHSGSTLIDTIVQCDARCHKPHICGGFSLQIVIVLSCECIQVSVA